MSWKKITYDIDSLTLGPPPGNPRGKGTYPTGKAAQHRVDVTRLKPEHQNLGNWMAMCACGQHKTFHNSMEEAKDAALQHQQEAFKPAEED